MPPDLALLSTLIGSNYPCLELICIVPKVFQPLKFECKLKSRGFRASSLSTYDLSTFYTTLLRNLIKDKLKDFSKENVLLISHVMIGMLYNSDTVRNYGLVRKFLKLSPLS